MSQVNWCGRSDRPSSFTKPDGFEDWHTQGIVVGWFGQRLREGEAGVGSPQAEGWVGDVVEGDAIVIHARARS
jgi:hypothetical protein